MSSRPTAGSNAWIRVALMIVGAGSIAWAATILGSARQAPALERVAARIVQGDRYKAEDLDRVAPVMAEIAATPEPRFSSLRAAVIYELRQAETAVADGRRTDIDRHMDALRKVLPRALATGPSDSFLWLALFWRETFTGGSDPTRLPLLEMSYRTGPREGWVAVRRSPWTLALYSRLVPDLQEVAVAEFVGLVQSGFKEAASILTGPGWSLREVLIPRLATVDEPSRKVFAKSLYRGGYDVQVPGIDRPSERPWSR